MYKIAALLLVAATVYSQQTDTSGGSGPYIWDLLPPPLTPQEITEIMNVAEPGRDFPIYNEVPETTFTCENANGGKPGFYADPDTGCQVIRRCTQDGQMHNYMCPNMTICNQLTLTCDYFWNVDCSQAVATYDFANSRLYQEGVPLHDTPPEGYIPEYLRQQIENLN